MDPIPHIKNESELFLLTQRRRTEYIAMYSSWFKGIVTNPQYMMIPIDDHIVHRGDGIFEALRFKYNHFIEFDEHYERLLHSAKSLYLDVPYSKETILNICKKLLTYENSDHPLFRIYISRGPGDFTPNPNTEYGTQLYIVLTDTPPPPQEFYKKGCTLGLSTLLQKPSPYRGIKSCNYIPNVLLKKESLERGFNFCVNFSEDGHLCEGATENILLISKDNELLSPQFKDILPGTTLKRILALSDPLIKKGILKAVHIKDIKREEIDSAKEIFMAGTTFEMLPIISVEGSPIGTGTPGTIYKEIYAALKRHYTSQTTSCL